MKPPIEPHSGIQLSLELLDPVPSLQPKSTGAVSELTFTPTPSDAAQGVSLYWVKHKNFWYYRYWYKESGKVHPLHIPGGNSSSEIAKRRAKLVEQCIKEGQSPPQIRRLINAWKKPKSKACNRL